MSNAPTHAHNLNKNHLVIEQLARDTDTPLDKVEEIFAVEFSKLEEVARIKTYVSVFASRRVKTILHTHGEAH